MGYWMEHAWLGNTCSLTYLGGNGRQEIRQEGRHKYERMPYTLIDRTIGKQTMD